MSQEHSPGRAGGRFGRIPKAVSEYGLSRSYLYKLAREHRGLFVKAGAATFVDFQRLDGILETLPAANLKTPGGVAA